MSNSNLISPADLAGVQSRIGYQFKDAGLLEQALTHSSAAKSLAMKLNNQRLEFLGDRVLGLIIAEMLFEIFPKAPEGELAQRFSQLVKNETCAEIAHRLKLNESMAVHETVITSGGLSNTALLADVCEALVAAIYIDAGSETVKKFIYKNWKERIEEFSAPMRDAKSVLNEFSQSRKLSYPRFQLTGRVGPDHDPKFTVEMRLEGYTPSTGTGHSKQVAEQNAAENFLHRENIPLDQ